MQLGADVAVVLVRHGETEWSSSGRTRRSPTSRSPSTGATQARRSRRASSQGVDFVARAHAARGGAPATTCEFAGLEPTRRVTDDLAEWNYGDYEGRTTESIRAEQPGWTIFTEARPAARPPTRSRRAADRLIARASPPGGPVALFSHAHFLRVRGAVGRAPGSDGPLLGLDTATLSLSDEREQRVLRVWNS